MTAPAVAINYDAILKGVQRLARVNPQRAKAVEKIVAFYVDDERKQAKADRERGQKRSLESRLLKAHRCEANRFAGFTQLPSVNDVRAWRCEACGEIVTLEKVR
jgi:hypothetical protein